MTINDAVLHLQDMQYMACFQNITANGVPIGSIIDDIIALLKAQEPRVMTLEEVEQSIKPVWIEGGVVGGTWGMAHKILTTIIEFIANGGYTIFPGFAIEEYGKTWRCWTSRPTDEQREAVKWE